MKYESDEHYFLIIVLWHSSLCLLSEFEALPTPSLLRTILIYKHVQIRTNSYYTIITYIFCHFACLCGNAYTQNFNWFCSIKPSPVVFQVTGKEPFYLLIKLMHFLFQGRPARGSPSALQQDDDSFLRPGAALPSRRRPVLPRSGATRAASSSETPGLSQPRGGGPAAKRPQAAAFTTPA